MEHLKRQHITSENQFNFLKGTSAESALQDKVRPEVIYFKFVKLFDKVPILKVPLKMTLIGIHPMVVRNLYRAGRSRLGINERNLASFFFLQ